ncbi:hypothetical protein B0H17DRAFT_1204556 [Mycena rosella]|uniref:Protein CPL1-like domain-containing protein n=1 Tax=Mycena rosella TaxID=1033263 RepID=A0AAD7GB41_MYCRO|nr:hypothetical protein B0H17DRAFT_1204556 [Mycena rosella]
MRPYSGHITNNWLDEDLLARSNFLHKRASTLRGYSNPSTHLSDMRFSLLFAFVSALISTALGRSRLVTRGVDAAAARPTGISDPASVVQCPSFTATCARHQRHYDDEGDASTTTFECIDTDSDFRSCGGCLFPAKGHARGEDCTRIEGAADAYCECGACVVRSCRPGYVLDNSAALCTWHGIVDASGKLMDNMEDGLWWWFFV